VIGGRLFISACDHAGRLAVAEYETYAAIDHLIGEIDAAKAELKRLALHDEPYPVTIRGT